MAHDNYQHMMSLSLDGALLPEDEATLERHLGECDACTAIWETMSGLDSLFRQAPVVGPAQGFSMRVMARVEEHRHRRRWPETIFWLAVMALLAGVMLSQWIPSLLPLAAGVSVGPLPGPLANLAEQAEALRTIGVTLAALGNALAVWLTYVVSLPLSWVVGLTTLALAATWVGLIGVFGPGQSAAPAREAVLIS